MSLTTIDLLQSVAVKHCSCDVSVSNLTKEELDYYNSGGTVAADRDGVKSTFSRKQGKWTRHEWVADIDPVASEVTNTPERKVFGERRLL